MHMFHDQMWPVDIHQHWCLHSRSRVLILKSKIAYSLHMLCEMHLVLLHER